MNRHAGRHTERNFGRPVDRETSDPQTYHMQALTNRLDIAPTLKDASYAAERMSEDFASTWDTFVYRFVQEIPEHQQTYHARRDVGTAVITSLEDHEDRKALGRALRKVTARFRLPLYLIGPNGLTVYAGKSMRGMYQQTTGPRRWTPNEEQLALLLAAEPVAPAARLWDDGIELGPVMSYASGEPQIVFAPRFEGEPKDIIEAMVDYFEQNDVRAVYDNATKERMQTAWSRRWRDSERVTANPDRQALKRKLMR